MKYLIMVYSNPENWAHPMFLHQHGLSADDRAAMTRQVDELTTEVTESGELVGGEPLADPLLARTIRDRGDGIEVVDGPFAEAKEQLAGFFVVDCESIERAVQIGSRLPDVRFAAVEVRPVMSPDGAV